jgi:hypothetical protein
MSTAVRAKGVRPKRSPEWSYFYFNKDSNKSECLVILENGETCGKVINGQFATNRSI